jgi:hypothetical protein
LVLCIYKNRKEVNYRPSRTAPIKR